MEKQHKSWTLGKGIAVGLIALSIALVANSLINFAERVWIDDYSGCEKLRIEEPLLPKEVCELNQTTLECIEPE